MRTGKTASTPIEYSLFCFPIFNVCFSCYNLRRENYSRSASWMGQTLQGLSTEVRVELVHLLEGMSKFDVIDHLQNKSP